jgi:alpha-2-macroglobulin
MTRANRRLVLLLAAALLLAPGLTVADPAPHAVAPHRPADARGTVIIPDTFLRRWDPVTIFFARDVGPQTPGPEDTPERFVTFAPAHPGAFEWLDARTLQFRPADPWPPLTRFSWRAGRNERAMVTLMSAPTETHPRHGTEGLGPVEEIALTFPEPLADGALERMITLEVAPLPAPANGTGRRWLNADDLTVKTVERVSPGDPARYVIRLADPIPLGHQATVHLRLALDPRVEAAGAESFSRITFATAEPFRVVRMGCRGREVPVTSAGTRYAADAALRCAPGDRRVRLELSATPGDLGPIEARNLVRFSPRVADLSFQVRGSALEIGGRFEAGTLYRMRLVPAPLTDTEGRALDIEGESEVHLLFPRQPTFLHWTESQGLLERHGPKQVPVEGRGAARVDLRIHRIDPLDRSLWPFPERPVTVDESARPPGPGEAPAAHRDPERFPTAADLSARIAALGTPPVSTLVDLPIGPDRGAARFGLDLSPHLSRIAGEDAPGTYLVGLRRLDAGSGRQWMRVQVTDLTLTTVEAAGEVRFVVTSLSTGRPVRGATIRLEGAREEEHRTDRRIARRRVWDTLATGRTGADGAFTWTAPGLREDRPQIRRIVVTAGDDVLVLDPTRPPDRFVRGHWHGDRASWLQWAFGALTGRGPQPEVLTHLFTERPVYRPEEKVHVQGYVRRRAGGRFENAALDAPHLEIEGPGDLKWRYPVTFTEGGSFHHAFDEADIPTGTYLATLRDRSGRRHGRVSFQVEAYRLPTFEVALHGPDAVPSDGPFEVGLTARYYAGGRVAARPLRWRVTQFPHHWTPRAMPGFRFSSDGRFSGHGRFESSPRLDREVTTDADGAAALTLDPTIEQSAQPRTYVVEATVVGADDQTVTAVRRVHALPPFVVGVKVPRVVESASEIVPEVVVVGHDGVLLAGREMTVRLKHRQWHAHLTASDFSEGEARYTTEVVDEDVFEKTVESAAEPLAVRLPIARAGVYVVEVSARDRLGRRQTVAVDLFAAGAEPVSWQRPERGVFEVSPDKAAYDPGETATVVLQSPFQQGRALAVIEGPAGNRYQWVTVRGGTATFRVPIEAAHAPRVPVHFVLMRGRVDGSEPTPGTTLDLGKPHTVASTTWIAVTERDHRVDVSLAHPERALPGETIDVEVRLSDHAGRPVGGEVALWLVDRAVLALGREQRLDPVPDFLRPAQSHLSVRDTRSLAFGRLPLRENPGGDGGDADEESDLLDRVTVRRRFTPVPFYEPAIRVDASGRAVVRVQLPDNLTDFAIRAKAVSGPERFGHGKSQVSVRLPLIVQPALPRFVRPGDAFIAAAVGRVVEGPGGEGRAEMRAEGLDVEGPASRAVTWSEAEPRRVTIPVRVPMPEYDENGAPVRDAVQVSFAVARDADGASDAFEVRLPIREDRRPVHRRILETVEGDGPLALPDVEEAARPGTVRRSVLASGEAALVAMVAGLDLLRRHPHEGTESRIARARVDLALREMRAVMHRPEPDEDMARTVRDTLDWLPQVVDRNGLVSHWPGGEGTVILTAWVVHFLAEAEDAGFPPDAQLKQTLVRSLERALRSDWRYFIDGETHTERTFALAALARAGRLDPSYASELSRSAAHLDLEAVAQVILALDEGAAGAPTTALTRRLWAGTEIRLHRGEERFGGLRPHRRSRSPRILPSETRTLAEMVRALGRVEPTHPRLPILVDGLVTLGRGDGWGSTNADAAALLALAERLKGRGVGAGELRLALRLGDAEQALVMGPDAPVASVVREESGAFEVVRVSGDGPVTILAETRYVPAADGSQVAPEARGLVVSRSLLRVGGDEDAPLARTLLAEAGKTHHVTVGDVVEEHVQVVSPEDRHYVAVSVPLAAGVEPLNPALATAPPEATPSGRITRPATYTAFLDDRVVFYFESLPRGTYDLYFRTRATTEGRFIQPAARAEMIYDRTVYGESAGARVVVTRE